jgi:hypothetical protein
MAKGITSAPQGIALLPMWNSLYGAHTVTSSSVRASTSVLEWATNEKMERLNEIMFDEWRRERFIGKTLRRLSQQRVVGILQPGNVWVIEKAVSEEEGERVIAALRTCNIRGWVEFLSDAIPHGKLTPEGKLPEGFPMSGVAPLYRLTEAGWSVIHRTHEWVIATFIIVAITLAATILSIFTGTSIMK